MILNSRQLFQTKRGFQSEDNMKQDFAVSGSLFCLGNTKIPTGIIHTSEKNLFSSLSMNLLGKVLLEIS